MQIEVVRVTRLADIIDVIGRDHHAVATHCLVKARRHGWTVPRILERGGQRDVVDVPVRVDIGATRRDDMMERTARGIEQREIDFAIRAIVRHRW